jgi:DNA-binding CsgD family transcriptional regulator
MSVTLSARDIARLETAASVLLTPLDYSGLDAWRSAVNRATRELLEGDGALFALFPVTGGQHPGYSEEYSLGSPRDYVRSTTEDGGRKRAAARGMTVFNQTAIVAGDWAGYRRDVNVNEFLLPRGIRDGAGLFMYRPIPGSFAHLMVGRNRFGSAGLGAKGLVLLRLLLPAFRAGVHAQLCVADKLKEFVHLIDSMPNGGLLASADGETLHESTALARLLDADEERSRLRAALHDCVRALAVRLRRARASDEAAAIPRAAPDAAHELRTAAALYSIWGCYVSATTTGLPLILVSLSRRGLQDDNHSVIAERFLLTAREMTVAYLLANGRSNKDISATLGVSSHTARRHTEHVLGKLGVHSRAEVSAVLRGYRVSATIKPR